MIGGFNRFGFERVICVPQSTNRRSIRVAEKLGMTFERSFIHKGKAVVCYVKANPNKKRTCLDRPQRE
jgi:RimJ/RimL family protein N-acetyltransferase